MGEERKADLLIKVVHNTQLYFGGEGGVEFSVVGKVLSIRTGC
jgi:hypothetical protein